MKYIRISLTIAALTLLVPVTAFSQAELRSDVATSTGYATKAQVLGEFVVIPNTTRSDTITLQYVPNPGDILVPPIDGDVAMRAKRTCDKGSSITWWENVTTCRTCQNWMKVRHCTDPSKPSTCSDVWIPDGPAETECGTAPSWMVEK